MITRANMTRAVLVAAGVAAVLLGAILPASADNGTWTSDSSGNWGDTSKWSGGIVADGAGFTATFGNVITANRFVTNEIDRTIGHISFLDTSHTLTITGTNPLTLADPGGTSEVYSVWKTLTISAPLAGTSALSKTGPGGLGITATGVTNTYSGGTVVNEGTLSISFDYHLGDPAGPVTMNGGTLSVGNQVYTSTRPFILSSGNNSIVSGGNGTWTCAGPVSGTGNIEIQSRATAGNNVYFTCLTNTFTGELGLNSGDWFMDRLYVHLSSLTDSPGAGNIYWPPNADAAHHAYLYWRSDATNALLLNNRRIEFRGDGDLISMRLINNNSSHAIVINTDSLVGGSGYKHFQFHANNAGVTNVIAGNISDGTNGATVAFTLTGAGDLVLSGNNTHSGTNTLSSSGTVFLEGEASLSDEGTLNITSGKVEIQTREKIEVLQFTGTPQSAGTWGSTSSTADNQNDTYFSGDGVLYVGVGFPPGGTMFIFE